jgi:hypothetical protein
MRDRVDRGLSLFSQDGRYRVSSAVGCGGVDALPSTDSMTGIHGTKGHGMRMVSGGSRIFMRKAA